MDELKKDARFAHIAKDPRFRPASKGERKLKIDRRFASMFDDPKFKLKYTVDKRGRPLVQEHTTRDDMNKFYHLENDQSSETSSDDESEAKSKKTAKKSTGDDALDELLDSDETGDDDDDKEEEEDDDDDDSEEEEEEGQSSSSEEDEEIPELDDNEEWNEFDDKCTRSDNVTRRLAVCNMDWDRVRAVDILLLLNSWKPADGVIKSVTIYPSEYGLKQMESEQKLGPLPGTTQSIVATDQNETKIDHQSEVEAEEEPEVKSDDEEENEENFHQDDDQDTTDPVMRERLRKYQLNRLKYFYAVVECDTLETASRIYEECDGLEYETSAVRLDLRFIPDSVTFDASVPPQDHCTELPDKTLYKPIFFRNTALTQTKVRCTWDETPIERRRLTRKKYTLEELEKVDLDAYLASESEEEPEDDEEVDGSDGEDVESAKAKDEGVFKVPTSIPSASQKSKRDQPIARAPSVLSTQDDIDRYRALLLDFNDDSKADKKPKKKLKGFFDERDSDDERPRQNLEDDDDDDDDDASDIDMEITWEPGLKGKVHDKSNDSKTSKAKKPEKFNQRKAQQEVLEQEEDEEEDETENHRETLELLAVDDDIEDKRDYNLRDMIKSHKQSTKATAKNAKKSRKLQDHAAAPANGKPSNDAFQLNVDDQRFQAVYNRAAFNIDQTDPHFKSTAGTQRLIEEKLKKRKLDNGNSSSRTEHDEDDLVAKLKRKSAKRSQ